MRAFYDRVEAYRRVAAEMFPGQGVFNKKELAAISGRSVQTIYNQPRKYCFLSPRISIEEFVRMELRK